MNSLFIEASAKTAVGVSEAFQGVVEKILDTPQLWAPVTPDKGGVGRSNADGGMPGSIDLGKAGKGEESGCSC
jgi:Ras-related protein Rab-18